MYRKLFLIAASLLVIAGMSGAALFIHPGRGEEASAVSLSSSAGRQPLYRIGAYHGRVAVYPYEENTPSYTTEIPLATLRQADRKKISAGLMIYSQQELTSFLEDFGS